MSESDAIRENIDVVEEAYEFMLAYAAQGRTDEGAGPDGAHIRTFLERFAEATDGLSGQVGALLGTEKADAAPLLEAFQRDCAIVLSVARLMLARGNISSEMVDNANGLIAMRAYLTMLFFVDKVLLAEDG